MHRESQPSNPIAALPGAFRDAIEDFGLWDKERLHIEQDRNKIVEPLYHYTDGRGLCGIIESGQIWFTDYRHLNDPTELIYAIDIAHEVAKALAPVSKIQAPFMQTFMNMFRHSNFEARLEFFIACFSRERDDLGQWRAYADDGRGYAIGLAPRLFSINESVQADSLPEFVGPVLYKPDEIRARCTIPLEKAAAVFVDTVNEHAELVSNREVGIPFMVEFAKTIIASSLMWTCLTSKHLAYAHEREVRLVIAGSSDRLSPHVATRLRGSEIVPYIAQPLPIREPRNIVEIVAGPAAAVDAEHSIRSMLLSLGVDPNIPVNRSTIPYRYVGSR